MRGGWCWVSRRIMAARGRRPGLRPPQAFAIAFLDIGTHSYYNTLDYAVKSGLGCWLLGVSGLVCAPPIAFQKLEPVGIYRSTVRSCRRVLSSMSNACLVVQSSGLDMSFGA